MIEDNEGLVESLQEMNDLVDLISESEGNPVTLERIQESMRSLVAQMQDYVGY